MAWLLIRLVEDVFVYLSHLEYWFDVTVVFLILQQHTHCSGTFSCSLELDADLSRMIPSRQSDNWNINMLKAI